MTLETNRQEMDALAAFMAHVDDFEAALKEKYQYRIRNLERQIISQDLLNRWAWTLAEHCLFRNQQKQQCTKIDGLCCPPNCPLIEAAHRES
jgi:hypothetical protein